MTKRVGILSLILAAAMAVLQPTAALAQDGYNRDHNFRDHSPRREERAFREPERRDFRGPQGRDYHYVAPYRGGYAYGGPRYDDRRYNNYYYAPARPYNYCR